MYRRDKNLPKYFPLNLFIFLKDVDSISYTDDDNLYTHYMIIWIRLSESNNQSKENSKTISS